MKACYLPCFWCTKVNIINTVQVHILSVPGKGSLPHAEIQVSCVDALNLDTWKNIIEIRD